MTLSDSDSLKDLKIFQQDIIIMDKNPTQVRIHYPLPLDYCGYPDPAILQATIRRLSAEIERLRSNGTDKDLRKRVNELEIANRQLTEENARLFNARGAQRYLSAIKSLENSVAKERISFRAQIQKLRFENASLTLKNRQLVESTRRKINVGSPSAPRRSATPPRSSPARKTRPGRSPSLSGRFAASARRSPSPGSSVGSSRSRDSIRPRLTKSYHFGAKEMDFRNLESRIQALQKMLKDGINLN